MVRAARKAIHQQIIDMAPEMRHPDLVATLAEAYALLVGTLTNTVRVSR